jgi:uncharacterized membrane protein YgcG
LEVTDTIETPTTEPTLAPTPSPTPEPDGVEAIVLIDNAEVVFSYLNINDQVDISGEQGAYYIATINGTSVLIDKRLVRIATEGDYESWSGYSVRNATMYNNLYLEGEPIDTLRINTDVNVLDDLGFCYRVEIGETIGYMSIANVSQNKIKTGGSSGGSNSGSSGGSSGGADGGDIVLPSLRDDGIEFVYTSVIIRPDVESIEYPTTGIIRADHVETYIGFLDRGDSVKVIDESDEFVTVIFSHKLGLMRAQLVRLPSSEEYTSWDGYAKRNTPYYDNYHMLEEPMGNLRVNTVLSVLCELDYCYLVNLDDVLWFVPKDQISTKKINTSGSSGSSGGSDSGTSSDWTDPVY